MNKKIIFPLLIVIIIIGAFGFWYYRDRVFSKEILKLEILGVENAKMGEEIEYTVKYKNNGNFALEQPKLIFELPDNSLTEDKKTRITQDIDDIYPGDEKFVKFKARLLGKEGELKVAHAWLSYAPKNITARYESDTTFTTKIDSVPMTLDYDLQSKAEKGKEVEYSVNYFSNVDYPLENLSIKIDPMNGFDFESSDPVSLDNAEWKLATLNKTQGGRITVKGRITADVGRRLGFSAKIGMWQNGQFVVLKEASKEVAVIEPLLFISQQINGSTNYNVSPGEKLHYEIFFRNIGSTAFENLFLLVRLDGTAFDLSSLKSDTGQARPDDKLIAWDWKQASSLQYLGPQQEGKVEFDVQLKDSWIPADSEKNNSFINSQVEISQIGQKFQNKINSKLELVQQASYSTQNNISNSGPIPPIVSQTTTYTVTWQIKNYLNDVKNVKVRATLPEGVSLTGRIAPENETSKFSFDSTSREIVWSVGDLIAGAGVTDTPLAVSFQISLVPKSSQRGQNAGLIGEVTTSGEDQFTGTTTEFKTPAIDTSLPNDPAASGKGIIQ